MKLETCFLIRQNGLRQYPGDGTGLHSAVSLKRECLESEESPFRLEKRAF